VEIGIPRGRFQVIRVHPNPEQPDGAFIIRIQDNESGITIVTTLLHDDGVRLASGFTNVNDPPAEGPASVLHLPDAKEVRVHGGGDGAAAELDEAAATPPEPAPAPPEPPAETPAG
jgi:hypothetical protein